MVSMPTEGDDLPVVVYRGAYEEVIFLKTLLEASGIPAMMFTSGRYEPSISVARRHVQDALPLVDDFQANGKKT